VIEIYFRGKKGHAKVARGEYCLVRTSQHEGCKRIITESDLIRARRPGSLLPMYMKVSKWISSKECGEPSRLDKDIQICPQCGTVNYIIKGNRDVLHWLVD
jgi:hypothetical protein